MPWCRFCMREFETDAGALIHLGKKHPHTYARFKEQQEAITTQQKIRREFRLDECLGTNAKVARLISKGVNNPDLIAHYLGVHPVTARKHMERPGIPWRSTDAVLAKALERFGLKQFVNILPPHLAIAQASWCRKQMIARVKGLGLTQKEIAKFLCISLARVSDLLTEVERDRQRNRVSPLERYLNTNSADEFKIVAIQNRPVRLFPAEYHHVNKRTIQPELEMG